MRGGGVTHSKNSNIESKYSKDSKNSQTHTKSIESKNHAKEDKITESPKDSKGYIESALQTNLDSKNIESNSDFKIDISPSKHLPLSENYTFSRGFGYWSWKPQIILQSLEKIKENDILIYHDIGATFILEGKNSLLKKLEILKEHDIANFTNPDLKDRVWAKGDVFDYFGVRDNPKYTDGGICKGGTLFMKKSKKTIDFMKEWLDIFWNHFNLVDDSPSKSPNYPEFIENRHDQAILSMLIKKHNIFTFDDFYRPDDSNIDFAVLHTRDKVDINHLLADKHPHFRNKKLLTKTLKILGKILPIQSLRKDLRDLKKYMDDNIKH